MFKNSVINIEISNDIDQSLAFAQSNGFESIEIHSAWDKNIELMDVDELSRLDGLVKAHGLKVSCLSSTLFLRCFLDDHLGIAPGVHGLNAVIGDYRFHLRALERALQAAEILDAPLIRVFGFKKEAVTTQAVFEMAAERFRKPAEMAKAAGKVLALENCPHTSFGWGVNAAKLVSMVDSPGLRLLWDPAGALRAGEPDCIQAMPDIIPLLAHVHAKDIQPDAEADKRYMCIGEGVVPWPTIFQELLDQHYQGAVSLETHYLGKDGKKSSAVLESRNAMQKMLAALTAA
jgi:sugar phosphate isomerase/epimerase